MDSKKPGFTSIDDYIGTFPADVQAILQQLRATIQAAAPDATEKISYQMPTFYLKGNLVHFAAWTSHIGFYPTARGMEVFAPELAAYKQSKGAVQFPLNQPLPLALITRMVQHNAAENLNKAASKPGRKK